MFNEINDKNTGIDSSFKMISTGIKNDKLIIDVESQKYGRIFGLIKSQELINTSVLVFMHASAFIAENKYSLGEKKLESLNKILEAKVIHLAEKQSGFLGFFRRWFTNINQEKQCIEHLSLIVKLAMADVKSVTSNSIPSPSNESIPTEPRAPLVELQNLIPSSTTEVSSSLPQAPAVIPLLSTVVSSPKPKTPLIDIPAAAPQSRPTEIPPTAPANNMQLPVEIQHKPAPIVPPKFVLAPSTDKIVVKDDIIQKSLTAPVVLQKRAGGPPPPPGKNGLTNSSALLFNEEPEPLPKIGAMAIIPEKYKGAPKEKLEKEIIIIQEYLNKLEISLNPVRISVKEVEELEAMVTEHTSKLKKQQLAHRKIKSTLGVLQSGKEGDLVHLEYRNKKTNILISNTPFFPESLRLEINNRREQAWLKIKETKKQENGTELEERQRPIHLQLISEILSKEATINKFNQYVLAAERKIENIQEQINDASTKISNIKKTKNNGIEFNTFSKLLTTKDKQISILQTAVRNRQNEIVDQAKPKEQKQNIAPVAQKEELVKNLNESDGEEEFNKLPQEVLVPLKSKDAKMHMKFLKRHMIAVEQ